MKLITNEAQLRSHIPNIIASVKGETPLPEKLSLFLDLAENWVTTTFTGESTFNTICNYPDSNNIRILCGRLVVAEAMLRAIPSLDIVLTPNGFGIVSTNNLAPASKPRIDRLTESMLSHRDDCIDALLPKLPEIENWIASPQSAFFGATLFPNLGIVDALGGATGSRWEKYLELRSQVIDLEATLADEWLSTELLSVLRKENLTCSLSEKRKEIVRQVKAQILSYLRSGTFNARRLADIVNYIRLNEAEFSEWHNSATAQLFDPPVFKNEKRASGYFF